MKIRFPSLLLLTLTTCLAKAQAPTPLNKDETLIFCYFKGNGQDGLHLASSHDGYT